jgi:hypothetical protein
MKHVYFERLKRKDHNKGAMTLDIETRDVERTFRYLFDRTEGKIRQIVFKQSDRAQMPRLVQELVSSWEQRYEIPSHLELELVQVCFG